MIRNDYTVLPVELLNCSATDVRKQCFRLASEGQSLNYEGFFDAGLFKSASRIGLDAGYLVRQDYMAGSVGPFDVHLAMLGSSACFVVHRAIDLPAVDYSAARRREVITRTLQERRTLHRDLLSGNRALERIAPALSNVICEQPSYAFSFCIFEGFSQAQHKQWETDLKYLAEPAYIGLESDEWGGDSDSGINYPSIGNTIPAINDVDLHDTSCVYITWSSIVAVSWGNAKQAGQTKSMILGLELKLQSAWNKCYALNHRIDGIIAGHNKNYDPEAILIPFTEALESVRGTVSSTVTSRYQFIFDKLRETSRIDEQIDLLARKLNLVERHIERRRNEREASYQRWITVFLGIVAIIDLLTGVAVVTTAGFHLWVIVSLAATGLALIAILSAFTFKWWSVIFRR